MTSKQSIAVEKISEDDPATKTPRISAETASKRAEKIMALTIRRGFLLSKGLQYAGDKADYQLDLLFDNIAHENQRFLPNDHGRSALFTTRGAGVPRRAMDRAIIFHLHSTISLTFTGVELRAIDDELVWMQLLHYGKSGNLGEPIHFSIPQLITDIGWPRNQHYYEKARACISRLKAGEIIINNDKAYGRGLSKSFITDYSFTNDGKGQPINYTAKLDPNLIYLLAGGTFTNQSWATYRKLTPSARRLADYVNSHAVPFPLNVEEFSRMCDSDCKTPFKRVQQAKKALTELIECGVLKDGVCEKRSTGSFLCFQRP